MDIELEKKLDELLDLYEGSVINLKNGQSVPFDRSSIRGLICRAIIDIDQVTAENKKLIMQNQIRHSGNFSYTLHDFIRDIKNPENLKKFKNDLLNLKNKIDSEMAESAKKRHS
jgi:hypothetical protein